MKNFKIKFGPATSKPHHVYSRGCSLIFLAVLSLWSLNAKAEAVLTVGTACALVFNYGADNNNVCDNKLLYSTPSATGVTYVQNITGVSQAAASYSENATNSQNSINGSVAASAAARSSFGDLGLSVFSAASGGGTWAASWEAYSQAVSRFSDVIKVFTSLPESTLVISGFIDVAKLTTSTSNPLNQGAKANAAADLKFSIYASSVSGSAEYLVNSANPNSKGEVLVEGLNFFDLSLTVRNGSLISLTNSLSATAGTFFARNIGFGESAYASGIAEIATLNSSHLFISSPDAQTRFISESGASYLQSPNAPSNSVPVPASIWLVLSLASVLLLRRK